MTMCSHAPRRWRGKALIALFAATAALAGGAQAAAPAIAMEDQSRLPKCQAWETPFFNDCAEEDGGGSETGSGSSGGSGDLDLPGEVIEVHDTKPVEPESISEVSPAPKTATPNRGRNPAS